MQIGSDRLRPALARMLPAPPRAAEEKEGEDDPDDEGATATTDTAIATTTTTTANVRAAAARWDRDFAPPAKRSSPLSLVLDGTIMALIRWGGRESGRS